MSSRKATTFSKRIITAVVLVFAIAVVIQPVMGISLALVGLLFVPVLLWLLGPVLRHMLPVTTEHGQITQTWVPVFLFQRPPPSLH